MLAFKKLIRTKWGVALIPEINVTFHSWHELPVPVPYTSTSPQKLNIPETRFILHS